MGSPACTARHPSPTVADPSTVPSASDTDSSAARARACAAAAAAGGRRSAARTARRRPRVTPRRPGRRGRHARPSSGGQRAPCWRLFAFSTPPSQFQLNAPWADTSRPCIWSTSRWLGLGPARSLRLRGEPAQHATGVRHQLPDVPGHIKKRLQIQSSLKGGGRRVLWGAMGLGPDDLMNKETHAAARAHSRTLAPEMTPEEAAEALEEDWQEDCSHGCRPATHRGADSRAPRQSMFTSRTCGPTPTSSTTSSSSTSSSATCLAARGWRAPRRWARRRPSARVEARTTAAAAAAAAQPPARRRPRKSAQCDGLLRPLADRGSERQVVGAPGVGPCPRRRRGRPW